MEQDNPTSALDTGTGVAREPIGRAEVLRGMAGRRRIWTLEQKLAIVAELERCDNIAAFSRRHDIRTSLLYTWRRELRYAVAARQVTDAGSDHAPMFVPVVADSPKPKSHDVAIEVELGGAVVRIGRTASPGLATAVIQALQVQR
jgi:transposase